MPSDASAPTASVVPGPHLLGAAAVAGSLLDPKGTSHVVAEASYSAVPTGGVYDDTDLRRGQALLIRCGLVEDKGGILTPRQGVRELALLPRPAMAELLTSLLLLREPPIWLAGAVHEDQLRSEFIPDADVEALERAVPDPARREAMLLALGQRFNDDSRHALGAAGETFVVAAAQAELTAGGAAHLAGLVMQLSLVSDQLGYDITSPTLAGGVARLEVKTVARPGASLAIYLSRNEAQVGLRDPDWALVLCVQHMDGLQIAGWMRGDALSEHLPADTVSGRWEKARLNIAQEWLAPGLPLSPPAQS